jgi:hypothetical protein
MPGDHEAYREEPNLLGGFSIAAAHVEAARRKASQFPLDHIPVQANDFVPVWAVEVNGAHHGGKIRDAMNYFGNAAVVGVNLGVLLQQTVGRLEGCPKEKGGG